jgi:hypothetical protein
VPVAEYDRGLVLVPLHHAPAGQVRVRHLFLLASHLI